MFPGYASRLEIELKKLYTENNLKLAKDKTIKIIKNKKFITYIYTII